MITMKTKLCDFCLNGDIEAILCGTCNIKRKACEFNDTYVEIARIIKNLSKKHNMLENIELVNVIDTRMFIIIIVNKNNVPQIIGKDGQIIKEISKKIGKTIKVLSDKITDNEVIINLLKPYIIKKINMIYLIDGEKLKIIMSKQDEKNIINNYNSYETAIKILTGKEISIIFE
ncbi:MAG: KH domain-containing protein [DPANN group archaeon]|nr:KH domain-containing protein [DPANN group archaeon]